jgi:DNA topoisomerase IA
LVEVFADLFDYGYTNTMEAELDKIEYAVNGDSGIDEIYENLCGKTLEDIKSRLTAIKNKLSTASTRTTFCVSVSLVRA